MSIGNMVLLITAILVFCGLFQRVLDRMRMTDRQALLLIGLMFIGTFLPEISLGKISVNIGGGLIPAGICVYLIVKAESRKERLRSIAGTFITGILIYSMTKLLPSEAEALRFDPVWVCGICGAITAWLIGRSRRAAFICGVAGTLLADALSCIVAGFQGFETELHLGGGGIADTCVISGVLAVLLCEIAGEALERLTRNRRGNHK